MADDGSVIDPDVRPVDASDADDIAQIEQLERDGRAVLVDARGGQRWLVENPEIGADWSSKARVEGVDVVVAHIGPVVVGYLLAELGIDHIIRVQQVWVEPDARENGFGDALLALAIERARSLGATAVEGQALPGDRHTKNLYERAGIVARLITTYRSL